jgi:hypothetical protein
MRLNEPFLHPKCNFVHPNSPWARPSIAAIICILAVSVQGMSQAQTLEERLRLRMSGYWDAMQKADFEKATEYIHPDSRKTFARVPRSRVGNWKIKSLGCNDDRSVCDTVTVVTKPLPGVGAELDWELQNQWVLQNGEYYFKIAWEEDANPLFAAFKDRQAAVQALPAFEEAAPRPRADPEAIARLSEATQRIAPAPDNPTTVHFGEKATFRFSYSNGGKQPIRILSAHSDCHCTSPQKEFSEVLPGRTATLEVVLDTFGLPLGTLDKEVYVQFDDLDKPLVVPIHISSLPNFSIIPPSLDFGLLEGGKESERSVRLLNQSGKAIHIISQSRSDPALEVSCDKSTVAPNEELLIRLRYKPLKKGEFFDNLMIQTDLSAEPLLNVSIRGVVAE